MTHQATKDATAARDILCYLMKNPEAKDTLEGIARFWLERERVDRSIGEVTTALRLLVDRGLVLEKDNRSGRPYYQINGDKRPELSVFLEEVSRSVQAVIETPLQHSRFHCQFGNVVVGALYAVFLYLCMNAWTHTQSMVGGGVILFNAIFVVYLLTRYQQTGVTSSARNWILAPLVQVLPLLMRPAAMAVSAMTVVWFTGQVAGLALMIASLLILGRSVGIVAAHRGIKTSGPYAWVRHPMYAGEILFVLAFLAGNPSFRNAALAAAIVLGEVVRSRQEEALLAQDEQYLVYRAGVRQRFIPGLV